MTVLSRLGLGVTGPHATAVVPAGDTVRLIHAAVARGVTLFDTGPMYGAGEGERRLGQALAGIARDRVFISTKTRTWSPGDGRAPRAIVEASVADSLARLGLARIDALFLHGPRAEDVAAVAPVLATLKAAGTIGCAGVCGRGAELDAALEAGGYDLLMMPVLGADARLARAASQGVGVLAIETMRGRAGPRVPVSLADVWYLARAARDALNGAAPAAGRGVAHALAQPAVRSVIVQTTRIAHLDANAAEAGLQIPRESP